MATDFARGRSPLPGSEFGFKSYGIALAANKLVMLDTSNKESGSSVGGVIVTTANTSTPLGVSVEAAVSGGVVRIQCYGIAVCTGGAAITAGDVVMPTAAGKVLTQTAAKPQVGVALEDCAADGDLVRVMLFPAFNH